MKKVTGKISKTFQWILAGILGLGAFGAFSESVIAGVFWLLAAIIACPVARNAVINFIDKKMGDKSPVSKIKGWMYGVAAFLLVCIGSSAMPTSDTVYEAQINGAVQMESIVASNEILDELVQSDKSEKTNAEDSSISLVATPTPTPTPMPTPEPTPEPTLNQGGNTSSGAYAVNSKNGKIHIVGACTATGNGKQAMTSPVYFDTFEDAEAYSATIESKPEKRRCGNCWR